MANTTNFSLTSILNANGTNGNQGNGTRILNRNNTFGIDFANDTVIAAAQSDVDYARGIELIKSSEKSFGEMALAHIQQTYGLQLSEYETALALSAIAKSVTDSLTSTQSSILDELTATNNEVANLSQSQATSRDTLNTLNNEKTTLNNDKTAAVNSHNNQINSTETAIRGLNGQRSTANSNLGKARSAKADLQSQLNSMPDSYQVEETNADGTKTTRTVSNASRKAELRRQIDAKQQEIERYEAQISDLDGQISEKQTLLEQQKAAKEETIAQYDTLIANKQTEIDAEKANLEEITNKLGEATLKQANLTQQADTIAAMMKEAQTFEKSVTEMMATAYANLNKTEAERTEAEEDLEVQDAELEEAENDSQNKENVLSQAEEDALAKYEREFSSENGFVF